MNGLQTTQAQSEEIEIDVFRLFRVLWKQWRLIAVVTMVCAVVTYLGSALLIRPTYRSSFSAYVNNRGNSAELSGGTTISDLDASISLTYLYQDIICSRSVLMDAAQSCGMDIEYEKLLKRVSTTVSKESGLITVYVLDMDPERATQLAAAIAKYAPEHVARMRDGSSMRILDDPVLPEKKFFPNDVKSMIVGALLGMLVCAGVIVVKELVYDVVRDEEELEQRYGVPVIGMIPNMEDTQLENPGKAYKKVGKR